MTITEIKSKIIKDVDDYERDFMSIQYVLAEYGNPDTLTSRLAINELEKEGLIVFAAGRMNVSLTKKGKKVASIGYEIYENQIEEEERQAQIDAKTKANLELKALQFNYTWRFLIILSFVISLAGLVVAILANMKPTH